MNDTQAVAASPAVRGAAGRAGRHDGTGPTGPHENVHRSGPHEDVRAARRSGPVLHLQGMRSWSPGGGRSAPAALDLRLPPGRRVAVLGGAAGTGRSVLTSVLLGLLDYEGSVTLDGVELRDLPRDRIRRVIGFAGRPPETAAGTVEGRLATARALLAEHPIVLFEEPDAHLDPATARTLLTDLLTGAGGRTLLLMTRRARFPGADPVLKHVDETVTLT